MRFQVADVYLGRTKRDAGARPVPVGSENVVPMSRVGGYICHFKGAHKAVGLMT
jgi:hypothetical protein